MVSTLSAMNFRSACRIEKVAVLPGAAVGGGFVAALDDFLREIWSLLDRLADHEGRELDLMLVHQVEDARHAFVDTVLEEGVGRQVGQAFLDRVRNHSAGSGDRLAAGLKHERETDSKASVIGLISPW